MTRGAVVFVGLLLVACPDTPGPTDVGCQSGSCDAGSTTTGGCHTDRQCGVGFLCKAAVCQEVTEGATCREDAQCGFLRRCGPSGHCMGSACLSHADCDAQNRCFDRRCVPLTDPPHGIFFERRFNIGPTEHVIPSAFNDIGYGFGGGLFDIDADGDLDLFLGARRNYEHESSPPCIFRNNSTPGDLVLEPIEAYCQLRTDDPLSGYSLDVENDGYHELLVLGRFTIKLWRFHPEVLEIDLLAQLREDDSRRRCEAGAAVIADLNSDGRFDITVGCQESTAGQLPGRNKNMTFIQDESGTLVLRAGPPPAGRGQTTFYQDDGSSLAIAQIDHDDDGLLDYIVANDAFSSQEVTGVQAARIDFNRRPGGYYRRCSPLESCDWQRHNMATGGKGWGSNMGIGNIMVEGLGEHIYIADQGPNRLIRWTDGEAHDIATEQAIQHSHIGDHLLFTWSALVDDFDRNGMDDLLITNGSVPVGNDADTAFLVHRDTMMLQTVDGFRSLTDEVGLPVNTNADSRNPDQVYAARAMVRADLDYDGNLDLIEVGLEGVPRLFAEIPTATPKTPRCTLQPSNRYIPTSGTGYGVANDAGGPYFRRDIQGQMRFGSSPWVLSTEPRGRFRFPTGAVVQFDCQDTAGPIAVIEPEWIAVEWHADHVRVTLDTPWIEGDQRLEGALRNGAGDRRALSATRQDSSWRIARNADDEALMLKLNGKWIDRWFAQAQ
jgi:hypothetical protein